MKKYAICLSALLATHFALAQTLPTPDHIVIMWDENRNYTEIVGNPLAPYINSLIGDSHTALFTDYYALISGSQPNYLMLFSGSTQGVSGSTITSVQFTDCNLGASLIAGGYTFIGYSDSLPSVGFLGTTSGNYARKHNPWSNWQGTGTNQLPPATNVPFTAFPHDFDSLPTVSFVVPDLLDDMHTPSDATAILPGDTWFKNNLDPYIQWAKTHNSLMIFGFDESSDTFEHILYLFIGQSVVGGSYGEYTNNYRTLRTIEQMYHLPYCGNSDTATAITSVFTGVPSGVAATTTGESKITVFPVPATDALHIRISGTFTGSNEVSLTDQLGTILRKESIYITPGQNELELSTAGLASGIYFIKVAGENINYLSKVIVAH